MDLHLGLALSSSSSSASSCSSHDLDLNSYTHESEIPIHHLKKRKYDHLPQTLPLLLSCNQNQLINDEHHQNHHHHRHHAHAHLDGEVQSNSIVVHNRNEGGVIGWPPVKLCRKKLGHPKIGNRGEGSMSMYVKVHMEGVGIARKVDVNSHHSYQNLVETLANMFGKCYEDVKLTYQDKEGDWLLAGDVPWGSFIKTIQRLKLLRK